jgi:hypothetical protein
VYDCENPIFARCWSTAGRVKASDRNTTPGSRSRARAISHSQKANGLVCGLSMRKIVTPRSTQNRTTSSSASHRPRQSGHSNSSG